MSVRKEIISWGRVVCVCGGGVFLAVQYFGTFAIYGDFSNERTEYSRLLVDSESRLDFWKWV